MNISQDEIKRYEELQAIALDFARFGQTDELKSMLLAKLPVNLRDHKGNTLLMLASYHGNLDAVKLLIDMGADANLKNDRGQTPLDGVCFKGYLDIAKLLTKAGANLNNSLMYACIFGHRDIVKCLSQEKTFKIKIYLALSEFGAFLKSIRSKLLSKRKF
jgi:ankyrin repeat protein